MPERAVVPVPPRLAARLVVTHHYLHRRPAITWAHGLRVGNEIRGVVTYGVPASRHLQKSACPGDPDAVIELNRLWVDDREPANTESWFVSRSLRLLPPMIVVSYADPTYGHVGYVYRALNFHYAGWTDMDRNTPRPDYVPVVEEPEDDLFGGMGGAAERHSRDAFRNGITEVRRRTPKVRYWITTGNPTNRRVLATRCGWPRMNWRTDPPPT